MFRKLKQYDDEVCVIRNGVEYELEKKSPKRLDNFTGFSSEVMIAPLTGGVVLNSSVFDVRAELL